MIDIRKRLIKCLEQNGIDLSADMKKIDSLSFITAIVDIENEFDIEFKDEYLSMETMSDFEKLYDIVVMLIDEKR